MGRSHDTKDKNFFGLGTRKVLSRSQAMIYYRDRLGGRLVQTGSSDKLIYQPPTKGGGENKQVIRPNADEPLSEMGYVIIILCYVMLCYTSLLHVLFNQYRTVSFCFLS